MDESEKPVIQLIADILQNHPHGISIAAFERILKQKLHHQVHRVFLGGYLLAYAEMGILEELDQKPAKVFRVRKGAMAKFKKIIDLKMKIEKDKQEALAIIKRSMKKEGYLMDKIDEILEEADKE